MSIIGSVGDAEAQAEYEQALRDALGPSGVVDHRTVERFLRILNDAVQAQRPWARLVIECATRQGLNAILREELVAITRPEDAALFDYHGEIVQISMRRGRRRRNPTTKRVFWQQALFADFSWADIAEWMAVINSQLGAALINQEVGERLMRLRTKFPETFGPAEACERLGTTIAGYLAAPVAGPESAAA